MSALGRQRPFSAILLEGPLSGAKRTSKTLEILDSDFRFRPEADPRRGRSEMISAAFALTLLPAKTPPSTFEVGLFLPLANDP